ncbi:phosphate ABC transporter substrate-binding protein PstS [candidate division KSB1 bacterium]
MTIYSMKIIIISALIVLISGIISPIFSQDNEILGAGATFPYPLYSKMFNVYNKSYNVRVNYQSIGSGGGIRQLINKTVDFGATDAFMKDEDIKNAPAEIVHIPICLGAVVVTYNLPGNPEIRLSPEALSGIFLGTIKKWNAAEIKNLNPEISLPDQNIIVVHRSDGSGTTNIFTDYLGKISPEWDKEVGRGKSVNWPEGLGAKGNEGVAGLVKQIPGSIGYVELAYTIHNNMTGALIKNSKGNFIKPSIESISASANADIPADTRVSLTNTMSDNGYPISGFTWIILYKEQKYDNRSREDALSLLNLLHWMTHEGQKYAPTLDYAPISEKVVGSVEDILSSVTYGGEKLLKK